jgi:hypothetical protein
MILGMILAIFYPNLVTALQEGRAVIQDRLRGPDGIQETGPYLELRTSKP